MTTAQLTIADDAVEAERDAAKAWRDDLFAIFGDLAVEAVTLRAPIYRAAYGIDGGILVTDPAVYASWPARTDRVVGCDYCRRLALAREDFAPRHTASDRCRSGKRAHCTCDTCF